MHFLRATSHDMRTPLQALEMALEELREFLPGAAGRATHLVARQSLAMLGLIINNVLDVNRIERDDMRLASDICDIQADVNGVVELTRPIFAGTAVDLVLRPPTTAVTSSSPTSSTRGTVRCDRARILRCVLNVLSNAHKFTREGAVEVLREFRDGRSGPAAAVHPCRRGWATRIWRAKVDDAIDSADCATFVVTVTDTGRGMSPSEIERAVLAFTSTREDNAQGSGLGLHVVLASVLAHHGWLRISSRLGEGTEVGLAFRVHRVQRQLSTAGSTRPPPGLLSPPPPLPLGSASDRSVLVVDDQVTIVKLLQRQVQRLTGPSVRVLSAADGRQAVELVGACAGGMGPDGADPVGLVFMDVNMPRMDGLEATRAIRSMASVPQPRIVVLTGNATVDDRDAAFRAGADAFEPKPCALDGIKAHLVDAGFSLSRGQAVVLPPVALPVAHAQEGLTSSRE